MKTKVAFFFLSNKKSGGTFQYSVTMLRAVLLNKQLKTVLFYTHNDILEYLDTNKTESFKIKQNTALKIIRTIFQRKALNFDDFDVVLSPTYDPILLGYKRKFIFTLHDLQEKYFPNNFGFFQKLWRNTLYSLLSKHAVAVICESEFVKKHILRYYPRYKLIYVVQAPQMLSDREMQDEDLYPGIQYFFYPAYFKRHKNHLNLLRAFSIFLKTHPDFHLVLTGEKKYEFDNIVSLANELGIFEKILFVGRLGDRALINTYRHATALVMPSLFESISIPILEAFQLGVPVCSSNAFGLTEQVKGFGYLFDPNNPVNMAEQMHQLVENKLLTNKYKVDALKHSQIINDHICYSNRILKILKS